MPTKKHLTKLRNTRTRLCASGIWCEKICNEPHVTSELSAKARFLMGNISGVIGEQAEVILLHEQNRKTLEDEIKQHLEVAQKQKSLLAKVEKERDKNAEEVQVLADKVEQYQG